MIRIVVKMVILWSILVTAGMGQLVVTSVQRLAIPREYEWNQPKFSPDGNKIYFTTIDFNGIWEYTRSTKTTRTVTTDPRSGFGFSVSSDGNEITYRRTLDESASRREQEIVVRSLLNGTEQVLSTGSDVSIPAFIQKSVVGKGGRSSLLKGSLPESGTAAVLGIDNQKILIYRNGETRLLDPLGNGSYIWPVLSPDKKYIMAYEMSRGSFIADLDGKVQKMIGRCDAARWSHDSRWIFYTVEKNDGHQITGSDIYYRTADEENGHILLDTPAVAELAPDCSPVDNYLVCSTLNGDLYLIRYEEAAR
jgi:hypothetical protein